MRLISTVLVLLLTALPTLNAQIKGPSIHFDTTERDLGKVTQGENIREVFSFTNRGSAALQILSIGHT